MLLESQAAAIEKARGRAGDLAHGLKTPLTVLTNNALTLREKGAFEIADEPDQRSGDADVGKIVSETVRMLQHTEAGERLSWEVHIAPDIKVPIDPHDFREITDNLLENASKWASNHVIATVLHSDRECRLIILDDGPGASNEQLPLLSRRGVRLDRLKAGSGLGLAIVSEIAEVYGLTLTLKNRPDGGFHAEVACPLSTSLSFQRPSHGFD